VKDGLQRGFKWRIGSGENIALWNHPWLSDAGRISPVSQQQLAWPHIIVLELLERHSKNGIRCWSILSLIMVQLTES